jgi:hypothetical protein
MAMKAPDRDDDLAPKDLSKRIKFSLRAKMQVAILKGNARIAALVGI